jgi:hypothetical protein
MSSRALICGLVSLRLNGQREGLIAPYWVG